MVSRIRLSYYLLFGYSVSFFILPWQPWALPWTLLASLLSTLAQGKAERALLARQATGTHYLQGMLGPRLSIRTYLVLAPDTYPSKLSHD